MELKDIRVFVCVPAVGKSYLCQIDDRFVDFDDMKARYKYGYESLSVSEMERLKGNRGKVVREDSTEYIKRELKRYLQETDKILLFAPNPQIVEMIYANKIPYCLVYHSKDCIDEIEQRMLDRGNQPNFVRSMIDPIDTFYEASVSDTRPAFKIELHRGEYLSDKILPIFEK